MAKATIAGLTVQIGANTKGFTDAIKEVDRVSKNISKDLKTVSESLKLDPTAITGYSDKFKLLEEAVGNSTKKVDLAQKAIEALNKDLADGKVSPEEYDKAIRALERNLESAKYELERDVSALRDYDKSLKDSASSVKEVDQAVNNSNKSYDAFYEQTSKASDGQKQLSENTGKASNSYLLFYERTSQASDEQKDLTDNLSKTNKSYQVFYEQTSKASDGEKELTENVNNANKSYQVYYEQTSKASEGQKQLTENTGKAGKAYMLFYEQTSKASDGEKELTENLYNYGTAAKDAETKTLSLSDIIKGNLISSAITAGLSALVDLAKSLASALYNGVKDIAQAAWNFTKESVSIAEENRQTFAKVGQVFGESKQQIYDWSQSAVTALGLTSGEAQSAAAVFGNMFAALDIGIVKSGDLDTNFAEMSTNLVQLAADVAAFNNTTTTEVLEAFQSGLAGTSRTLRQYGIVLTAAGVEQKALELGLKDNKDELTEGDKMVARYALMMEQAAHQTGQFARESDSATVQSQVLHARIKELQGEIGDKLIPVQARFYKELNDFLESEAGQELFNAITDAVGDLANKIMELADDGRLQEWISSLKDKVPEVAETIQNMTEKIIDILPKLADLVENLLAFFGIETQEKQFARETKEAFKDVRDAVDDLAKAYNTDTETIRKAIALFAEENDTDVKNIYENWDTYGPKIKTYLSNMKDDYNDSLLNGAKSIIEKFADDNLLELQDIYNNWDYFEPLITTYAETLGSDYDDKFRTASGYIQAFSEQNGIELNNVLNDWSTYEPQINEWLSQISTDTETMENAVSDTLDKLPTDAQESVNRFASIDFTALDSFRERIRGWAQNIIDAVKGAINWFKELANVSEDPNYQTDTSLIDQSTPDYIYGDTPAPSYASGGGAKAGKMIRVNDDAGRRTEYFIPSVNGTILNGNQTEKLMNSVNNSRNFSGGINIYVNSYGMNVAEVAEELGQAFQNKIRMSGAVL